MHALLPGSCIQALLGSEQEGQNGDCCEPVDRANGSRMSFSHRPKVQEVSTRSNRAEARDRNAADTNEAWKGEAEPLSGETGDRQTVGPMRSWMPRATQKTKIHKFGTRAVSRAWSV